MSDNFSGANEVIQQLLEDEEDNDNLIMLLSMPPEKRMKIDSIFTSREEEDCFQILIKRRLIYKEEKFRKYCRLKHKLFDFVLSVNKKNTSVITSAEKLFLTLR